MDIKEVGWENGWIELAQDSARWRTLVNEVKNYPIP